VDKTWNPIHSWLPADWGVQRSGEESRAADFTLEDIDGGTIHLSDHTGRVVILDFWATWCNPCVREIPHYNELAAAYSERGLGIIGLSVDEGAAGTVRSFREGTAMNYPVAMCDDQTYTNYQSCLPAGDRGAIPFTFIIDRSGIIRQYFVGYREKAAFEQTILPLL